MTNTAPHWITPIAHYLQTRYGNTNANNHNTDHANHHSHGPINELFALLATALDEGHTCIDLSKANLFGKQDELVEILTQLEQSDLCCTPAHANATNQPKPAPIVLQRQGKTTYAWLHRQWQAEQQLAQQLLALANAPVAPINLPHRQGNTAQQQAIDRACTQALSLITGGPGTGKTYTIAQLVTGLYQQYGTQLSITLAAPTGKAAKRMQQALRQNLTTDIVLDDAKTIHRLLGIGQNGVAQFNQSRPLAEDVVIIDEASMLGLELASQLVQAIKLGARLILLGDADQLAAVDAGAVLADLCHLPALQAYRTHLTESRRFLASSAIGKLAMHINQGNSPASLALLADSTHAAELASYTLTVNQPKPIYSALFSAYQGYINQLKNLTNQDLSAPNNLTTTQLNRLFTSFDAYRILTAGHFGTFGVSQLNTQLTQLFKTALGLAPSDGFWFHGQPVMLLTNNYHLGVFNGDIGLCLKKANTREYYVYFPDKPEGIAVSRLSVADCATAFAMTIHKSQGSEFNHVAVVLAEAHQRMLSRELVYTAITRAKQQVSLYANEATLSQAIANKAIRETGLHLQF